MGALLLGCERARPEQTAPAVLERPPTQQGQPWSAPVVARLDGSPITLAEVQGLLRSEDTENRARRRGALDGVVARRLAAELAVRDGLTEEPEVRAELEAIERDARARREALLRDALFRHIRDGLELSEEDVRAHYDKTRARFFEPRIQLRRQTFPSRRAAELADAELGPAGRLDPAASEILGPAPVHELPRDVLPEALTLREPGERTVAVRGGGAALVELVELLPAEPLLFETVRERVEARLRTLRAQQEMHDLLDEMRGRAELEVDESVLDDESLWQSRANSRAARWPRY